jgi:4-hydroxybenzoate polyprenyltransferase/phosphoserine phosphatase
VKPNKAMERFSPSSDLSGTSTPQGTVAANLPLCVDLDGTLVHTDMLVENFVVLLRDWKVLLRIPFWLIKGKPRLKNELAKRTQIDPAVLPYCKELLDYLQVEKSRGRYLVLATAADRVVADRIADHLGIFDEVLASDGSVNLSGKTKGLTLCARYGERQFSYAGNGRSDLAVWESAGGAVLVNASSSISHAALRATKLEHKIDARFPRFRSLLRAMRPYQWSKNVLVFLPILTSNALRETRAWFHAGLMFLAFCAVASALYLLNDLTDLAADRKHPRKKQRPFASGALPLVVGLVMMPVLLLLGGLAAVASSAPMFVALYALVSLSYSFKLKEMPLIDLFTLSALYTLRLFAGGQSTGHPVSLWLLAFSSFLFLSLVIIKRVAELGSIRGEGTSRAVRRGYEVDDQFVLIAMGMGASFASSVVLALYVQSQIAVLQFVRPFVLWAIVPLMLFWQCRMWLSTARGYMRDDPIVYAARDWVSWLVGLGLVSSLVLSRLSF